MAEELTHFDNHGNAAMVDVSEKEDTLRAATAKGSIIMSRNAFDAVKNGTAGKGDVLGVARVAGIMGAKRTAELIPLCHPLMLTKVGIDFELDDGARTVTAICTAKLSGKTGVEMEALTGVSVALLTIYDMCKAIDKSMEISRVYLVSKSGGKSGRFESRKE